MEPSPAARTIWAMAGENTTSTEAPEEPEFVPPELPVEPVPVAEPVPLP